MQRARYNGICMSTQEQTAPLIVVAFGITGDLMRYKILPALFSLYAGGSIPQLVRIVGVSRQSWSSTQLQTYVATVIQEAFPSLSHIPDSFLHLFYFQQADVYDDQSYETFAKTLQYDSPCNILFYLSIAPELYEPTLRRISQLSRKHRENDALWTRILIEKPFGHDLMSAQALQQVIQGTFDTRQIYLVDHYLQKPISRQLTAFRQAHPELESIWNKEHIAEISIRLWETIGVEKRATFYDQTGALRDVGQNHVMQLLALITMDLPEQISSLPQNRVAVIEQLALIPTERMHEHTYHAQYRTYREEIHMPSSRTETYFALHTGIDSPRWRGTRILVDAGKRLPEVQKYIHVQFKKSEFVEIKQNIVPVQSIQFLLEGQEVILNDSHHPIWSASMEHTDYENIILDCIRGDQTFFVSMQEILASWNFVDPIERSWDQQIPPLASYEPGSAALLPAPLQQK